MRLVIISDTHNFHRQLVLPDGDVLIHAGDSTGTGTVPEVTDFLQWFASQPHSHKLMIAGNHDWLFEKSPGYADMLLSQVPSVTYLQDSGVVIDGVRFWGSPWQPWFHSWAFNLERGSAIAERWALIPDGTQVLITHGPPFGMLDWIRPGTTNLGCEELKKRVAQLYRLRVHAFGHIHGGYGRYDETEDFDANYIETRFVNASICNEAYEPVNAPIVVEL
jgi:predicted phosphohydrolase